MAAKPIENHPSGWRGFIESAVRLSDGFHIQVNSTAR